jgi:hypothetical protein
MPSQHEHTSLLALGLNFDEDDGAFREKTPSIQRWT